jgi:CHRD domain
MARTGGIARSRHPDEGRIGSDRPTAWTQRRRPSDVPNYAFRFDQTGDFPAPKRFAGRSILSGVAMSSGRRFAICLLASVGLLLVGVSPASAEPGGVPFTVELTGEAEVTPVGGDPDGSGTATVKINAGLEEVCWTIEVIHLDAVVMAHIHVGAWIATGPIVVHFDRYQGGCAHIERDLALAITTDPSAYYVNVHTTAFPAGAVRGQLDRPGLG